MPTPKGGYFLADRTTKVPSTTTIIGRFKESGALMHWAFEQGKAGKASLYDERQSAAGIGTYAHAMVEAHIKDWPLPLPPPEMTDEARQKAHRAYDSYLTWERHSKLEIVRQEIQLVDECHRFGGTLDAIGLIDLELCLLDWKTSNGCYPDMLIQLAAYQHLWNANHPLEQLTGGFHLLRFSKNEGDFHHHYFTELDEAWGMFCLYRQAYDLEKALKRRVA